MSGYTEWRRNFYLAKIKEAEEQAAKALEPAAVRGFWAVAEGYRALMRRLAPPEPWKGGEVPTRPQGG